MIVDAAFWQARWSEGKIGFHEGKPNGWLERRVDVLEGQPSAARSILVPMAGKAVDVAWLAARGHRVVAVEIVEQAVEAFFAENGLTATRTRAGAFERHEAGGLVFLRGDVFDLRREDAGPLDAAFDRAALIALEPAQRERYVAILAHLLGPGGRVLLIGFQHGLAEGPPFDLTPEQVDALWSPHGRVERLGEDDITEQSAHITAKGATRCLEAAYQIVIR
jgi:thiopurine S-methyltransferase